MRTSVLASLCLLAVLPRLARAECAPGAVPTALAARVDRAGIEVLTPPLVAAIPRAYELPDKSAELFSCTDFFDPTVVHMSNGRVALAIDDVDLQLDDGVIVVSVHGDVVADTGLRLDLCGLDETSCPGRVTANAVTLRARLRPSIEQCDAAFTFDLFEMEVAPEDVTAELFDCGLYGDTLDLVHDSVRAVLLDDALTFIEGFLRELLVEYVESFTTELFAKRWEGARLVVSAQPERITVKPSGLSVSFRANATPTAPDACVANAGAEAALEAPVSTYGFDLPPGMVAVGASAGFAQRVVRAAWLAGWMCFDTRVVDVDLEQWIAPLLPGATVAATLRAQTEPQLTLAPTQGVDAYVGVQRLEGSIDVGLPNGEHYPAAATASLALRAAVGVDDATRSVALSAGEVALSGLSVQLGAATLGFSAESVSAFIENAVLPAFADELDAIPLISGVLAGAPVAATIDRVAVQPAAVTASLSLLPVAEDDATPPVTLLDGQPRCPCGSTVTLSTSSTDDSTPVGLVRHRLTVDGVEERSLRAGTRLELDALTAGQHRIELRAVDLAGNVDPTPVRLDLDVDDTPPVVRIVRYPVGMVPVDGVEIEIEAEDDASSREALVVRYVVSVVSRANVPDTFVRDGAVQLGQPLRLDGLPDLSTVRITVQARDQAGNLGEADVTFAVVDAPTMGCTAAGSGLAWLVALAALPWLRRRRRAGD